MTPPKTGPAEGAGGDGRGDGQWSHAALVGRGERVDAEAATLSGG